MADEKGAKPKVELKLELDDAGEKGAGQRPADAEGHEPDAGESARDGLGCVRDWVRRTFPGDEGAFWGGVAGLAAAVVFLVLGVWYTVVISAFVLVGVAVGQVVDGDPKIWNLIRRLFSRNQ